MGLSWTAHSHRQRVMEQDELKTDKIGSATICEVREPIESKHIHKHNRITETTESKLQANLETEKIVNAYEKLTPSDPENNRGYKCMTETEIESQTNSKTKIDAFTNDYEMLIQSVTKDNHGYITKPTESELQTNSERERLTTDYEMLTLTVTKDNHEYTTDTTESVLQTNTQEKTTDDYEMFTTYLTSSDIKDIHGYRCSTKITEIELQTNLEAEKNTFATDFKMRTLTQTGNNLEFKCNVDTFEDELQANSAGGKDSVATEFDMLTPFETGKHHGFKRNIETTEVKLQENSVAKKYATDYEIITTSEIGESHLYKYSGDTTNTKLQKISKTKKQESVTDTYVLTLSETDDNNVQKCIADKAEMTFQKNSEAEKEKLATEKPAPSSTKKNVQEFITQTDEIEMQTNSKENEHDKKIIDPVDSEHLLNQNLETNTYVSTKNASHINDSLCSQYEDDIIVKTTEKVNEKCENTLFPKSPVLEEGKETFSLETLKYFNVNGKLSINDITNCLEYLQRFTSSFSSKITPKITSSENLPHVKDLTHFKPIAAYTNTCKANPVKKECVKFANNSELKISVIPAIEGSGKKVFRNVTVKKEPAETSFSNTASAATFSNYASSSQLGFQTCQYNFQPIVPNAEIDTFANKRRFEETYQNSLLPCKKYKTEEYQYYGYEMWPNYSFPSDFIPYTMENTQTQTRNPYASQIHRHFPVVRDPRLHKSMKFNSVRNRSKSQGSETNDKKPFLTKTRSVGLNVRHQDFYPAHQEMPFCILDWEPKWLVVKNDDYPPLLGNFKPTGVKYSYKTKEEYSETYCSIHLLSIWQAIQYSWKSQKKPKKYDCLIQNIQEFRSYYKNECVAMMPLYDLPKYSSIILITCTAENGTNQSFGYVYEIISPARHSSQNSLNSSSEEKDLHRIKFYCYTTKKIGDYKNYVNIQRLCRVRVHMMQYDALCLRGNSDLIDCIINPLCNARKIRTVTLPSGPLYNWNACMENLFTSWQPEIAIALILNLNNNAKLVILTLVRRLMTQSTILICIRDMEKFLYIAKTLGKRCVLAVKESEISVPKDIQQYTLRSNAKKITSERPMSLERSEVEVLKKSKIIVTLVSSIYFGDTTAPIFGSNLVCIIDDAHKCTEAETSLPLSFNPKNVILLGDSTQHPHLDYRQQRLLYHKTLFHRLWNHNI